MEFKRDKAILPATEFDVKKYYRCCSLSCAHVKIVCEKLKFRQCLNVCISGTDKVILCLYLYIYAKSVKINLAVPEMQKFRHCRNFNFSHKSTTFT